MKAWVSLGIVGVMAWIGFSLSDPVFDSAAEHLCLSHAEISGLELEEASGRFGYRRYRNWLTPLTPKYSCTFSSLLGERLVIDELDHVMDVTWESRGLRFVGWLMVVSPIVAAVTISGITGLLKRDD